MPAFPSTAESEGKVICLYRAKKHGAWFCTKDGKPRHCSVFRAFVCILRDLIKPKKGEKQT